MLFANPWTEMPTNIQKIRATVDSSGWSYGPIINSRYELESFARDIGTPIANHNGDLVQVLRVIDSWQAKPRTLSARFGNSEFPLHTDLAFWKRPARYLLMWVAGDLRRQTTLLSFSEIGAKYSEFKKATENALWVMTGIRRPIYTGMRLPIESGRVGLRFDSGCMSPVNNAAEIVANTVKESQSQIGVSKIDWTRRCIVVIDNWQMLHGRASGPNNECERVLHRMYMEKL